MLRERQAEFFHRLWDNPGGAVKKETLLALELSPDYRHECGICDRDYRHVADLFSFRFGVVAGLFLGYARTN